MVGGLKITPHSFLFGNRFQSRISNRSQDRVAQARHCACNVLSMLCRRSVSCSFFPFLFVSSCHALDSHLWPLSLLLSLSLRLLASISWWGRRGRLRKLFRRQLPAFTWKVAGEETPIFKAIRFGASLNSDCPPPCEGCM